MSGCQELSQTQSYAPAVNQEPGKKIRRRKLDYETANEYLRYDPETGLLHRKKPSQGQKNESPLHPQSAGGYMLVSCGGLQHLAHRVIWLLYYGYLPESEVDHINNCKFDNRITNLREVSRACNARNTPAQRNSTTGITGVSYSTRDKKWLAQICTNYRKIKVGDFDDFDEAVCHRLAAEQCLDWDVCRAETPAAAYVKRMTNT